MPDQNHNNKPQPTIDERLEAITMNLEIVAGMQQASEKAIATLGEKVDKMADSINMLGKIAGLHQEHIDEHEESLQQIVERLLSVERNQRKS